MQPSAIARGQADFANQSEVEPTMIIGIKTGLSIAILLAGATAHAAGALPNIDVQKMCRAAVSASFADRGDSFETCMKDEQAAREKLSENWTSFPTGDKSHCVLPSEYLPGYIEWLTCLELEGDFRRKRNEETSQQAGAWPTSVAAGSTLSEAKNYSSPYSDPAATPNGPFFYLDSHGVLPEPHKVSQPPRQKRKHD
jgi:hypothetical protein